MTGIDIQNLSKFFGEKTAVDSLSFTVPAGQVTGFLGPNGAGKSTTMRMVLGLDRPDTGQALIDGLPYRRFDRPLTKVGALLDAKAMHPGRSARSHLRALARSNGLPARRVDEVLELTGITAVARKRAGTFSLGMGQRLGIAAALLGDPEVLIFDEPVNGLDPDGVTWIRTLMRQLACEGRTILVSSHLMSEMQLTADRLVIIGKGRLIAQAPLGDILSGSSFTATRVVSPHAGELAMELRRRGISVERASESELVITGIPIDQVGDIAFGLGVRLHELSVREASLEQAYRELTKESVEYMQDSDALIEGRAS